MRKHHPHSRAERLALKELDAKHKDKAAKVRRQIIESLKDQETENELRQFKNHRDTNILSDIDLVNGDSTANERPSPR